MKVYHTGRQSEQAKEFFDEYAGGKLIGTGGRNLSVDGSGEDESVTLDIGRKIAKYAKAKFYRLDGSQLRSLDIGTGKGILVREMMIEGFDTFGIEGYAALINQHQCPRNRIACVDLTVPLTEERLKKGFDFTTSFELIEHIHRSAQDVFFTNLAYLADFHLCSVHVWGWPGTNEKHCNIKHECCWMEYFRSRNIEIEILGRAFNRTIDPAWSGAPGAIGGHLQDKSNNEFRDHVFGNNTDWECSFYVLLDLRKMT